MHSILPTPTDFGLPSRYSAWRQHQDEAFIQSASTDKPIVGIVAPCGLGKTVIGETLSALWGTRSAYLVLARALQSQVNSDFPHRYDVRGKQNYPCRLLLENDVEPQYATCDQAEALCDGCAYKDRGCHYYDRIRGARAAQHILPNYSMWFAMNRYSDEGLGEFGVLICDEAHELPLQLCKALRIELGAKTAEQFTRRALPAQQPLAKWRDWAAGYHHTLSSRLDALKEHAKATGKMSRELKELKGLVTGLQELSTADDSWIEDRSGYQLGGKVGFEPISPAPHAQRLLFRRIKRIVLMSASLVPKHIDMLGLSRDEVEFLEFPSSFPISRRPIIHVKTVQQKSTMTYDAKIEAVRRLDQIVAARLDRKWLIDTVSFDRSAFIREHSRYAFYLIANGPSRDDLKAEEAMRLFKESAAPKGLMGPSFRTGYDLPGSLCETSILYKIPFSDGRNPLNAARRESDPEWELLSVLVEIIQFFGRAMRSESDSNEGIVLDDMWSWVYPKCQQAGLTVDWFDQAVRMPYNQTIPRPPPKLMEIVAAEQA